MLPAAKEDAIVPEKAKNASMKFFADLAAGGVAGGLSKTIVAPIERVKLLLQTQDSNPRIKSGKPVLSRGKNIGTSPTLHIVNYSLPLLLCKLVLSQSEAVYRR